MPNWCYNALTVSGDPEELKRFVKANMGLPAQYPPVYDKNGKYIEKPVEETVPHFCFNAMVPTPKEVLEMGFCGHEKISAETKINAIFGKAIAPLDGYHWNIINWGTKWDIYHDNITEETLDWTEGCDSIFIDFDTAWSPPTPWFETIVSKFPTLHFTLHYEEPGFFFAADVTGENGHCIYDYYDDERCEELFNWSDDPDENAA